MRKRRFYGKSPPHGENKTKLYSVWNAMKERCRNPNDKYYAIYGGRGIGFCPEWQTWQTFKAWALDAGYIEGLSLDRADNDGDYAPANCRWATVQTQMRNRRSNRPVVRSDGKIYRTMIEGAEDVGANKASIYAVCKGKAKTAKGFGWRYHP